MSEKKWYADKGFVRGGFYDAMGGMLVGAHSQDIADRLNSFSELEAEKQRLKAVAEAAERYLTKNDYDGLLQALRAAGYLGGSG